MGTGHGTGTGTRPDERHLYRHEPRWRIGLLIDGGRAVAPGVVTVVIGIVRFSQGAWFVMVLVPVLVLVRLDKQEETEAVELEHDVRAASQNPVFRRQVVLLMVGHLDRCIAQGIQYARTLNPEELRAVHIATDAVAADRVMDEWLRLGLGQFRLELADCPDRRLVHAAMEVVAQCTADGGAEVTVLVPRRVYRYRWHSLLHDHTAEEIATAVGRLPHTHVAFVPFHLGREPRPASDRALVPGWQDAAP
ncbi:MAG: nucleic acid binding OB-fold tRNA/helicase-type [Acidimicrobiales bacterium]|nr:nucleic acid binding OB-fold tRNA/helicase-type [Acidimicrobiales bacterium]